MMTLHYNFGYDSAGPCSFTPPAKPGAAALGSYGKSRWSLPLIGISNCRPTASGGYSTHGEGRGIDLHVSVRDVTDPPVGSELMIMLEMADWLVANAEALGVQRVIRLDKEWDSRPGQRYWSNYTSTFHGNHVHTELCKAAADHLTLADIESLGDDMPLSPADLDAITAIVNRAVGDAVTTLHSNIVAVEAKVDAIDCGGGAAGSVHVEGDLTVT